MRAGRISFGVIVALALAGPALAQTQTPAIAAFKSGPWTGRAQFDAQRNFEYCLVYRGGADGLEYGFRINSQLGMMVGLSNQKWSMQPSTGYEFSLELGDYKKTIQGAVSAEQRTTLWFNVGNDAELRRAIAGGGTLNLSTKGSRFALSLSGSDNAMRKLLACTALFGVE